MLNLFEHVHYPNFISFSSDLMQLRSQGRLLSLMLMLKSKSPWRRRRNVIQKKYGRKRRLLRT